MNKTGSAAKVKLNSFDDLFGDGQPQAGIEQVQEIALSELHEFKGHPFKVLDDEKMQETVESVREHGVLMPGIARPRAEGGYEIIAGHRRRHACELVGLDTMPMFIRNYTDDEATIIMVDSNIQREDILPSEKAKAYRMKYEAMKHQGRTTAQGIYDQCTPVSAADAKAGDIIFFTGTYNAGRPVTHVGIYCGNGTMVHCGDPIQYTSINTSYWQSHFYGFGRLN